MSCNECYTGTIRRDAVPTGREEVVHGLPTYVTGPDDGVTPLGTVVFLTDAFGWKFRNSRVLADSYARRVPCTVYVPDMMNGHGLGEDVLVKLDASKRSPTESWIAHALRRAWNILTVLPSIFGVVWLSRQAVTMPRLVPWMRAVRSSTTPTTGSDSEGGKPPKIGVAGFCWGGLYSVLLTHDKPDHRVTVSEKEYPLVDCAFSAHPGMLKIPADIDAVVQPLSVANGDNDEYMGTKKMEQLVSILGLKNAQQGHEVHEAVVYPGAKHGFAVRGDWDDPPQKEQLEESEDQAVAWFRRRFETPWTS
ncbi:hypothetical protein B0H63DRAFT_498339 [Podospora didyma]|uniref:Dienelactone hydrolase domain-containing protein n=1 Tax=Podospora didyma TaxID=330526 RepID=A0AAE0U6V7_9PEZI|nr:hypothetical protein B0H63DRAFT_498339 [Podospora didyma]